ncbi:MAG: hypothetical protein D6743_02825 [Calditrichaeota bacterium]|nr:MAG: hypothetical protein D6743_02825 [Calditrichota bacterium]
MYSWTILLLYLTTFSYYFLYFKQKQDRLVSVIRVWLIVALIAHSGYLVLLAMHLNHLPVGDLFQVMTTSAWFFALAYLALEVRLREMTMGVFFIPIVLCLHAISSLFIDFDKPLAAVLTNLLFEVHVAIMISAYAAFAISFIASIMYIMLSSELRSKKLGIFFQRLPSLAFFDNLSNGAVNVGIVAVTLGMLLGFYMGMNVWEGSWAFDPKLLAVVISWAIYVTHFATRKFIGWQGRRAAIVSVVGFNWLLFSFIVVNLFLSKFHNFQ